MSPRNYGLYHIAVLMLCVVLASAAPLQDDTPESEAAVCVYRISGTYGSFSRWLFYSSVLMATISRHHEWLAMGVMATAMLYSSSAALHAWVILFDRGLNPEILDLDIIPIMTIVLFTCFSSTTFMFGMSVQTSKARGIFCMWTIWIWMATIACCATVWNLRSGVRAGNSSELACRDSSSTDATLLSSAAQLWSRQHEFNCTYSCFEARSSRIRTSEEILIIASQNLHSVYLRILPYITLVGVIVGSGLPALIGFHGACVAYTYSRKQPKYLSRKKSPRIRGSPFDIDELKDFRDVLKESGEVMHIGDRFHWILHISSIPGLLVVIVGEAAMLRKDGVLRGESYAAVGQWSTFVIAAFAVLTSLLDKYLFAPLRDAEFRKPYQQPYMPQAQDIEPKISSEESAGEAQLQSSAASADQDLEGGNSDSGTELRPMQRLPQPRSTI